MQFPFSIHLFNRTIPWHQVLEPLAFFIAFRYYLYLKKKRGDAIESEHRLWILVGATFGAVLGSRIIGGLEDIPAMMASSNKLIYFYQNKTVLGGFLGGLLGTEAIKKAIGEKKSSGDLFVYPILLGLIIGRVGCFSMGIHEETYGIPTRFFTGMYLGDGILRHPVTLYEIVLLIGIWVLLARCSKHYVLAEGLLFKYFLISYCIFRFLLDFIKPHYSWAGLSTIQWTSLAGIIYYTSLFFTEKHLFSYSRKHGVPYA